MAEIAASEPVAASWVSEQGVTLTPTSAGLRQRRVLIFELRRPEYPFYLAPALLSPKHASAWGSLLLTGRPKPPLSLHDVRDTAPVPWAALLLLSLYPPADQGSSWLCWRSLAPMFGAAWRSDDSQIFWRECYYHRGPPWPAAR